MDSQPQPIAVSASPSHKWMLPPAYNPYHIKALAPSVATAIVPRSNHNDAIRMQVLAVYAETGNATLAARTVGVPQPTANSWVNAPDAPQLIDDLRSTIRYECGWELARMVKRQMALTFEAMERGNAHVMRDGRIIYAPASAKDSTIALSILLDKWMLISGALSQSNALLASVDGLSKQLAGLGASLTGSSPSLPTPTPLSPDGTGENLIG